MAPPNPLDIAASGVRTLRAFGQRIPNAGGVLAPSLEGAVGGRTVLITGASSGIGKSTALKIGEAGGIVLLVARTEEKLQEVANEIEDQGGVAYVHPCNLSDVDDIDRMAAEVLEEHEVVDVLVNNAGKSIRRSVDRSYERFHDYQRTMQLNYFGPVKLILDLLPSMRERGNGHIINISTIGLQVNTPRFAAYVASKAALDAFSRSMAPEVIGDGVHVTTIYMPLVRTPMIAPTKMYDRFPTLSPDQAAHMITDAIRKRPKRMATAMGTIGQITYAIAPGAQDLIASQAYQLFPEGDGNKPKNEEEPTPEQRAFVRATPRSALVSETMKLEGIHHITAITADAQGNVDFYAGVLGLRLVKKSVNQDDTSVYHLFYADETGDPGSDITFFEYPGVPRGRPGAGMIHRVVWRVTGPKALDFWADRLAGHGYDVARLDDSVVFDDPEGLTHELRVVETTDEPLIAEHPEIPAELALQGFHAARAYADDPEPSRALLEETLGFTPVAHGPAQTAAYELRGDHRGGFYLYDPAPPERGLQGAGSVHHIAWASQPDELGAWREQVIAGGAHATPIIDRHYFRSVYFREPSGVLFELATIGPGFTVDEPLEHLGEKLSLTPQYEHLREQIEPTLTPLRNPRDSWIKR